VQPFQGAILIAGGADPKAFPFQRQPEQSHEVMVAVDDHHGT